MASDIELYLAHLERLVGRTATSFHRMESDDSGLPRVSAILFEDTPHPGQLTAATSGLSLSDHPKCKLAKPELMISLESTDRAWALAIGDMAKVHRGKHHFPWGSTIRWDQPIASDSEMSGFFIFAPTMVEHVFERDEPAVQLARYKVHPAGVYPLHASELALFHEIGLERFWKLPDFDPWNVRRTPITAS